ncbi:MAG: hypothetical protein LUQ69_09455 [Methanoregulaceae archaeon]|nr:hypothetical protein [Methanoregulaceae archaeon]
MAFEYPDLMRTLVPWQILAILAYHWPGNMRELEKFGTMGGSDYAATNYRNPRELIRGTTSYCHHNFFDAQLFSDLESLLTDMGIDSSMVDAILKKSRLSLNYTFRYDVKNFFCSAPFKRLKSPRITYRSDFPEIAQIEERTAFQNVIDGIRALANLLCVNFQANENLIDTNSVYRGPWNIIISRDPGFMQRPLYGILGGPHFHDWSEMLNKAETYVRKKIYGGAEVTRPTQLPGNEEELLKTYYRALLLQSGENIAEAARRSGMKDRTFRSRLKKYDIKS